MTECKSTKHEFQANGRRRVVAGFDGGNVTSDAGGLLLREVIRGSGIIERFARCFTDYRDPEKIEHSLIELIAQRTVGIVLGYEDLNDHDRLRFDPLFATLVDKADVLGQGRRAKCNQGSALAGKSTLNRLELTPADAGPESRYSKIVYNGPAIENFFIDCYIERHKKAPAEVILDIDATDDPTHGNQEGSYFHGYYDHYCYLPLYIFSGDDLLSARLRTSDCDPSEGVLPDLCRIVNAIRAAWPGTRIIVRGDSGFCREELMAWCEVRGVHYVLGLAKNSRLEGMIKKDLKKAKRKFKRTGKAAKLHRNLKYRTLKTWSKKRRVVAKAEHLEKGANPRFVVTTLDKNQYKARALYEEMYCARGDMENRIKEQQMGMFADRTSTHTLRGNQLRLWLSSLAYVLISEMRRVGLKATELESAQSWTIRERLFKIGATVAVSVRRIVISMATAYPWQETFLSCLQNLKDHYRNPAYG